MLVARDLSRGNSYCGAMITVRRDPEIMFDVAVGRSSSGARGCVNRLTGSRNSELISSLIAEMSHVTSPSGPRLAEQLLRRIGAELSKDLPVPETTPLPLAEL